MPVQCRMFDFETRRLSQGKQLLPMNCPWWMRSRCELMASPREAIHLGMGPVLGFKVRMKSKVLIADYPLIIIISSHFDLMI